jgi:hypothetical protein
MDSLFAATALARRSALLHLMRGDVGIAGVGRDAHTVERAVDEHEGEDEDRGAEAVFEAGFHFLLLRSAGRSAAASIEAMFVSVPGVMQKRLAEPSTMPTKVKDAVGAPLERGRIHRHYGELRIFSTALPSTITS